MGSKFFSHSGMELFRYPERIFTDTTNVLKNPPESQRVLLLLLLLLLLWIIIIIIIINYLLLLLLLIITIIIIILINNNYNIKVIYSWLKELVTNYYRPTGLPIYNGLCCLFTQIRQLHVDPIQFFILFLNCL